MEKKGKVGNLFSKALEFVKGNLNILYSLMLLVCIPAAFFVNNYLMNSNYEKEIDAITRKNALLVENIVNNLIQEHVGDSATIQSRIERVKIENEEILELAILRPENSGNFTVVNSTDPAQIGQPIEDDRFLLTQSSIIWNRSEPAVAYLDSSGSQRYWRVIKKLFDNDNQKIGLIVASFSLDDSDARINGVISESYWVLVITILIVVLLIANQARMLDYAVTVTKLQEVDRMKDMFMSMASHELRTPLTAIKWYLDALRENKNLVLDEESNHYITNLLVSAKRLNSLVEDILEVSRIEGNRLPMEISVFDANAVVAQSIDEMKSPAQEKGLALNLKLNDKPVSIKADPNRLKQIVVNLVGNAIKYTLKGSIEVSTSVKKEELVISVADTGIGISSEDQAKLFKKFSRIINDKTRDILGTGLGLWITFEIVKRMQGKVSVESIEGVGSHFTVRFPLAKVEWAALKEQKNKQKN
ncbi:MAG TPA: HAMP domain-containing sensor histidine kinase [Candidatus Paceibacterota bacterium]|nr:HAMP domain-containing sensor histidine kinase [Candidatus Pacearchaeota archaeon]HRZ50408.1 HAMP domain-containing sensor histidine kinase [Candidatus Paceibacterota bacterium]HSA36129.1 HAMP domain-containing sensor histidine kinase [Candidatus Paceibacterota bacterium]